MSVGEETIYMKIKAGKFKAGCWMEQYQQQLQQQQHT